MPATPGAFADAVIVAAGSSSRMSGTDKLGAALGDRSLLRWATEGMAAARSVGSVIVVVEPSRVAALADTDWVRALGARVLAGGARRQDTVAAGVRAATAEVVLVHDGARPFVTPGLVDAVAQAAAANGAAIPVLPVVDSLKRLSGAVEGGVVTGIADRTGLFRAQTPQAARRDLLRAAVDAFSDGAETFGDEAELLARYGVGVTTVPGDPANLKVTVAADLELAQAAALGRNQPRYGLGSDSHPFGPRDGLRLGGIEMAESPRLHGHSDGDAALHAVCDGLLAAVGLGDLGRLFPAGDPATRGIDSRQLVGSVVERLAASGWRPSSLDLTILGARPRLGGVRLERMREALAGLLGVDAARVSVKASTGNLGGPEGSGLVISATALVGVVAR
jgi:2-C-methyl-D-erythritol 4-phosphate cytidylyltransferase/2-C-methyl-D-erythritol 2,4-cyclodiphosphate synthase